jgi:iron-chelate-transporting ATPase
MAIHARWRSPPERLSTRRWASGFSPTSAIASSTFSRSAAFARKVAYLPQQLPPAEGMTVRELVAIGRYPWHGRRGGFIEQQTAAILRHQHGDPRPLAFAAGEAVQIAVLHDINMAARYCDYLVALRGGEMIAQGTPAELMRSDTLERDDAPARGHQPDGRYPAPRWVHRAADSGYPAPPAYLVALRGGEMIAQGTPAELMRSDTLEQIYGIPMGILPHPALQGDHALRVNVRRLRAAHLPQQRRERHRGQQAASGSPTIACG